MTSSSSNSELLPPVILIVGAEATLRDAALLRIRTTVLSESTRDFNEDRFDLATSSTDSARIIGAARTLPVLAEQRLVVVSGLGDRRGGRFMEKELLPYLKDPVLSTCLVLEAPKVDRRLSWVKQVGKLGEVIDCSGPSKPAERRAWIEARIRQRDKRPGRGTSAALLDLVGGGLDALGGEIDKLCLYVGDRAEVNPDDVSEVTGQLRPRALYELTEAMGQRRAGPSLVILAHLLEQGEHPLVLLTALGNHFRRLVRASECRPVEAKEIQHRLSVHPFAAQKLAEQVRGFSPRRLRTCLSAIRRTDAALKGAVPLPSRLAIEQLVLSVCA